MTESNATELKPWQIEAAERRAGILRALESQGVTVSAEFIPLSRVPAERRESFSGGKGKTPLPTLNWRVTVSKGGRAIMTTDYSAGSAHCPGYKFKCIGPASTYYNTKIRESLIAWECENGKKARTWGEGNILPKGGAAILPDNCDVIAALISDSDVLDAGGFESWAGDCGYDTDSRKAESVYAACLDIALKLRAGIGEAGLNILRDACRDY